MSSQGKAESQTQSCPICKVEVRHWPRYPNYLCGTCSAKAVDEQGRALKFYNASMSGGFEAHFADDDSVAKDVTDNHIVFVDGVRVWADEARFGGIVLTLLAEKGEKQDA